MHVGATGPKNIGYSVTPAWGKMSNGEIMLPKATTGKKRRKRMMRLANVMKNVIHNCAVAQHCLKIGIVFQLIARPATVTARHCIGAVG